MNDLSQLRQIHFPCYGYKPVAVNCRKRSTAANVKRVSLTTAQKIRFPAKSNIIRLPIEIFGQFQIGAVFLQKSRVQPNNLWLNMCFSGNHSGTGKPKRYACITKSQLGNEVTKIAVNLR